MLKTEKFFITDDIEVMMEMRHAKVENGEGKKMIDSLILDGHIMTRIITVLPVDENFIVHGYSREKPSSQQSRCWHMSVDLERDCDELEDNDQKTSSNSNSPSDSDSPLTRQYCTQACLLSLKR